ncbi:lysozyme inhibitor LprI family protein [Pseudocitrobacter corydidari]|uniref:lysozyme inhibitor LprI family protein n=1 Tax=Pseudocitrobacter corydidari TaxID=2891570 RepID=UPI001E436112|nr:lysozyme inhibitor LprI family protein [Pseudocitrobacter corydidari]
MKIKMLMLLFIPCALWANDFCTDIQVSDQVFDCAKETFTNHDAEINKTYKALLSDIKKRYSSEPETGAEVIEKIKISQRAWIHFRDANCPVFTLDVEAGSQVYETSLYDCESEMTIKRTEELKTILKSL